MADGTDRLLIKIGVAASFTAEALGRHKSWTMADSVLADVEYKFAPYNQLFAVCQGPETQFGSGSFDTIALLWRLEDIAQRDVDALSCGKTTSFDPILDVVDTLCEHVLALRKTFEGTLVLSLPPMPRLAGTKSPRANDMDLEQALWRATADLIHERLSGAPDISLLDLDEMVRRHGEETVYDNRRWYLYRQPFAEGFMKAIDDRLRRIVVSERFPPKKCIVLDCDNTLWGGVVGELGPGGIQLGDTFPGRTFMDFQRQLLSLKSRGIFLGIASKNNENDVMEVFDTHDDMVLSRDDISIYQVHWERKSLSISRIAEHLNISTDACVFIDDSPTEIAEVEASLPDVHCIMVPEELTDYADLLRTSDLFDAGPMTDEDRIRVASMQNETARKALRKKLSHEDYLKSLDIEVEAVEARPVQLDRVAQLINKTNQFNLTTRRRTLAEVRAIADDDSYGIYTATVADKFGAYGLTAVCILRFEGSVAVIDSLLMSCRVLSRGIEEAFLAAVATHAIPRGAKSLSGTYIPTKKNQLVAGLYERLGFSEQAGGNWSLSLDNGPPGAPIHIDLTMVSGDS